MNIIDNKGADPWITKGEKYLYSKSTNFDSEICIGESETIEQIGGAALNLVVSKDVLPPEACAEIWAPELHQIDGRWYVYYAASNGDNRTHRMHVLQSVTENPIGKYEYIGKISPEEDKWAIDGTVMKFQDKNYFIWSGWEGDDNGQQDLYISEMKDPTTLDKQRSRISTPEFEWEKKGMPVNEGPAILYHEKDIYLAYSASASWTDDYCIGLIKLMGSDPLEKSSWEKQQEPFYSSADEEYGPGHCSFTKDNEGNDLMIYHTARHTGAGWDRLIRAHPITWKDDRPFIYTSSELV